jgi:hypothetical protein
LKEGWAAQTNKGDSYKGHGRSRAGVYSHLPSQVLRPASGHICKLCK